MVKVMVIFRKNENLVSFQINQLVIKPGSLWYVSRGFIKLLEFCFKASVWRKKSRAVIIFAGTDTGAARALIFGIAKFKNP